MAQSVGWSLGCVRLASSPSPSSFLGWQISRQIKRRKELEEEEEEEDVWAALKGTFH